MHFPLFGFYRASLIIFIATPFTRSPVRLIAEHQHFSPLFICPFGLRVSLAGLRSSQGALRVTFPLLHRGGFPLLNILQPSTPFFGVPGEIAQISTHHEAL